MYIGMAVGVYYTSDVTAWTLYNTGLPNVPIYDLEINHTNAKLRAGTFGRGLWETPLFGVPVCDIASVNATSTPPSCPGGADGTLTVTATCTTCASIQFTITPTSPPGPPIVQIGNGVFTNLSANSYTVSIEDTANASCNDIWVNNPVVLAAGTDGIAPAVNCPVDVSVECGNDTSPASTGMATASDNCDPNPAITFSDSSAPGCGLTEVISRTWTVTDASGNVSNCTQVITVVDSTSPTSSCTADITVNNDPGFCEAVVNYSMPTGSDGCGNVTITQTSGFSSGSIFPVGTTTNAFIVTDDCGNVSSCSFDVTVVDNENPALVCPPDQTVDPGAGNPYTVPDYFATGEAIAADNCTSPVSNTTQNPTAGTQLTDGVYTVTITATDAAGNMETCAFQLTVDSILGVIDRTDLSSIDLYLNPAKDRVMLSNPGNIALVKLDIFNVQGQLIKTIDLRDSGTEKVIDVSELSSGNYLFIIYGENGQTVKQIVKE
jgi:hypothetical protein